MEQLRQTENLFIELDGEGAADLICIGARVRERFSVIPEMRMEFTVNTTSFNPKSILGKRINLKTGQGFKWSGLVISVEDIGLQKGVDVYAAELRPWLWLATLGEENRVFQKMSALEVIREVFDKMGISDFESLAKGTLEKRDYCVQYGETNYDFVCRLMEEEGIYFFFDHEGTTEKLILANEVSAHVDKGEIPFTKANVAQQVRAEADTIYEWAEVGKVVSAKVSLWDYDFALPNSSLLATKAATGVGSHSYNQIERYQTGGHYQTADKGEAYYAAHLAEAHAADFARATGLCNTELVRTGVKFKLKHPDWPEVEGSYLVVASTHYIRFDDKAAGTELQRLNWAAEQIDYPEQMALYAAEFEVQPSATPFRPHKTTQWPAVPSLLTALVTGPAGEEIHTDEYGRIRVQFPWDRHGKKDDASSCWVRTVMPWTGKDWGFLAVPRIGMEVIIQFERGNIDRPICTGMVYNGVNKPPYALPGDMNKMGWRTNSTKGGGGFHELTMDDTKGKESIFFQSQRDLKQIVKNDAVITIGMETKDKGDLTETIYRHKTLTLKTGNSTYVVEEGSEDISIAKNQRISIGENHTENIGENAARSIGKDSSLDIGGSRTENVDKNHTESIGGASAITVGKDQTEDIGKTLTITAGTKITLQVGSSTLVIDKNNIKLTADAVTIETKKTTVTAMSSLSLSGKVAELKADGIVTIKGSLTKIN